jgi:hypothetical protein
MANTWRFCAAKLATAPENLCEIDAGSRAEMPFPTGRPLSPKNADRDCRAGRRRFYPIHFAPEDGLKATSSRS